MNGIMYEQAESRFVMTDEDFMITQPECDEDTKISDE